MKILVLGGTGAMGTPLVEILSEDHQIFVTSRKQHTNCCSVQYVQGDAHKYAFFMQVLEEYAPFDAIVDFMIYQTAEFKTRLPLLLSATKQYIFLSSSRIYANSKEPLTEASPRLLDVSTDRSYLSTDEYALAKARQEDLLAHSESRNWTIVRPYITYNVKRLQLGVFEKESWLFRALHGRTIVFPQNIAECYTTLTYGGDVAAGIAKLVGNPAALGEKVHITAPEALKWSDVLGVYLDTLEDFTGRRPPVIYTPSPEWLMDVKKDYDVVRYDRLFNRRFNNDKFRSVCGTYSFLPARKGLRMCLSHFLQEVPDFQKLHWKYEAYVDRMTGERTPLGVITGLQNKRRYFLYRWLPKQKAKNNH